MSDARSAIYKNGVEQGVLPALSGSATDYLDGTGSWSVPAGGGGGGASSFDATVGAAGADYTTVAAALTAGYVSLLMADDTTETGDIATPTTGYSIHIPQGFTWNTSTYKHTYTATADVYVTGDGIWQSARAVAVDFFENGSYPTSLVRWDGVEIDDNGTQGTYFSNGLEHITNVVVSTSNATPKFHASSGACIYDNIKIVGGSTNVSTMFSVTSGGDALISNIEYSGTHKASTLISAVGGVLEIVNLIVNVANDVNIETTTDSGSNISNITSLNGSINFYIQAAAYLGLSNSDLNGGYFDVTNVDNCQVSNVRNIGLLDLSDTGSVNCLFSNIRATSAVTVGGDRHRFNNCDFLAGVTVNNNAVLNRFTACQFGPDTSDSTTTITDNNSANNTGIVNCTSCAAIAGTGTPSTAANDTY
jgi:hypothetical protein